MFKLFTGVHKHIGNIETTSAGSGRPPLVEALQEKLVSHSSNMGKVMTGKGYNDIIITSHKIVGEHTLTRPVECSCTCPSETDCKICQQSWLCHRELNYEPGERERRWR